MYFQITDDEKFYTKQNLTLEETSHKVKELNSKREKIGLPVVSIVEVPMVKAYDGEPISSTRIRCGEVDSEGRRL